MTVSNYVFFSVLFNIIGICIYIFTIAKSRDLLNPMQHGPKLILSYTMIFSFYLPFIISFIHIVKNNKITEQKVYIAFNCIWLLIVSPLLVFKYEIWNYHGSMINITENELVDTSNYDDEGNLIRGTKRVMSPKELVLKRKAAKSEYNERIDIDGGIYN